jgi:repressor LexA
MRTNDEIIEIIKDALIKKDISMSELARRVDMAKSAVSRYLNKTREFPLNRAEDFAKALGVPSQYLLGVSPILDIEEIYNQLEQPRQQKVYNLAESELEEQHYIEEHTNEYDGLAAAGEPIDGQQPVPMVGIETVRLLVDGDSMEPKYSTGDVIEYQPQPELENGEIGVFAVNGGVTLKRFRRNGDVRLESLNKKYDDIVVQETDDFNILGKVL